MLQNLKKIPADGAQLSAGLFVYERVAGVFTKLRGVGCDAFKFHFGFSHLFLMHPARFPPRVATAAHFAIVSRRARQWVYLILRIALREIISRSPFSNSTSAEFIAPRAKTRNLRL